MIAVPDGKPMSSEASNLSKSISFLLSAALLDLEGVAE
jgi:hypothetical protein